MPKKLKNLIVNRVDLVGEGDNPKAHIALFKRKNDGSDAPGWASKLQESIEKLMGKEGVEKQVFDFEKFLKELNNEDLINRINNLPDEAVKKISDIVEKLDEEKQTAEVLEPLVKAEEGDSEVERLKSEIALLKEQLTEKNKQEEDETEEDEDVLKGLPEKIRKQVEATNARAQAAEERYQKMLDEQDTAKYVEKAKAFTNIAADSSRLGVVLKGIASTDKESYAYIEATLKAANEALAQSDIFLKETGSSSDSEAKGSAFERIEAEASELIKSDPKLTKEQAFAKVIMNDPSKYNEYQKEINEEV